MRKILPRMVGILVTAAMLVGLVGVIASPAGAQTIPTGAPKVSFDTEINKAVGTLGITALDDPAAAGYTAVTDFVVVTVKSTEGGDSENVLLTETGNLTGIFKGTVTTAAATAATGTANNGTLSVGIQAGGTSAAGAALAAGVSSLVDRLDVSFDDKMTAGTAPVFGRALIDVEAPKTTVVLASGYNPATKTFQVTVTATDDKSGAGYVVYPTAAASAGPQAAGEAGGVVRVEYSINGGAWIPAAVGVPIINAGPVTVPVDAPTEGSYKVQARAVDAAGNVEVAGAGVTVLVDVTAPAVTAQTAIRAEAATNDADASKVVPALASGAGGDVTLKATVAETGSGINVRFDKIELDAAGKVKAGANTVYDVEPKTNVVANAASIGASATLGLKPSDAALQTAVDAAVAAGTLVKGAINDPVAPITLTVIGTGDWSADTKVANGTTTGAKTVPVVATDIMPLASTAVNIVLTVVADTTAPAVGDTAFAPGPAYPANITVTETQPGELVTITVNVTDDLSGISAVTGDFTALAPTDYATAFTPATGAYTMAGVPPPAVTAVPLLFSGTPGKFVVRVQIGAAVTAGDKSIPIRVTDQAGATANAGTGAAVVKVVAERTTMSIALTAGLNFISIPKGLSNPLISDALADLPAKVRQVVSFVGDIPKISAPMQTTRGSGVYVWKTATNPDLALNALVPGRGYIIDMKEAATLALKFATIDPTAPPAPVPIAAGWNLVGFSTRSIAANQKIEVYLSGLPWKVIYNYPGWGQVVPKLIGVDVTNWPNMVDFNPDPAPAAVDLQPVMVLGKSYWVYTSADGQIIQ